NLGPPMPPPGGIVKIRRMIRDSNSGRPALYLGVSASLLALSLAALAAGDPAAPKSAPRLLESGADPPKPRAKVGGGALRGPVASALLPEKQLPGVLAKKLVEDLPVPFDRYAASLVALGLIEPTPDLEKKLVQLYAKQVIGFYDPAERKFYVVPERSQEKD